MAKRFQQNQRDKIKAAFKDHVYYKLCRGVYDVFLNSNPNIIISVEDLFVDASKVLDNLLENGDRDAEMCKSLWADTLRAYRELDGTKAGVEDSKTEVAMLFYCVMLGMQSVQHSHYRGKLQRVLHNHIHTMWNKDRQRNCDDVEQNLKSCINVYTRDMLDWMEKYFTSTGSLTTEIEHTIHPHKNPNGKNSSKGKTIETKLYTLAYNCNDQDRKVKLIGFVRRKWEEWDWIETNTDIADFEHFFDGKPRDCHLVWKKSGALLSLLLEQLLNKNELFEKQTGCSSRSIVINQFKKSYDRHFDRVDSLDKIRIEWTIKLLNYKIPLELPQLSYHQGEDISDQALQEVFGGNMSITKDLNKYKY